MGVRSEFYLDLNLENYGEYRNGIFKGRDLKYLIMF